MTPRPRRVALTAGLVLSLLTLVYLVRLPDVKGLAKTNPKKTAFMELAEKKTKKAGKKWTLRHEWIPLGRVSPHLVHAVILSEDAAFWKHEGVDFEEMKVAMERNLEKGRFAFGASTITQQLAKNLYLSPSKNPLRKLKEYFIARRLEDKLTKRRILELYMNVVEWGPGVYGAEAAANYHFGKPASALTAEEAVSLATALPNPKRFPPDRFTRYLSRRRTTLLARMRRAGYLGETPTNVAR